MELFVTVLSIVALLLAIWQSHLALRQVAEARAQTKDLSEIRTSLSTRYMGPFPDYVPDIVELVKSATRSIDIFCDFPAYSIFSRHGSWLAYRYAVEERLDKRVRVRLTVLNQTQRVQVNHKQWGMSEEAWNDWKAKSDNRDRLERFLAAPPGVDKTVILTNQEFQQALEDADRRALTDTFARADVVEINDHVPVFFWIVDDRRAIFTFDVADSGSEYGFFTLDQRLIHAFQEIQKRYRGRG